MKQGVRSETHDTDAGIEGMTCLYRGPNGTKCAAGILISDEVYDPEMENMLISNVVKEFTGLEHLEKEVDFLNTLQEIHDDKPVEGWDKELRILAEENQLTIPILN